MSEQPSLFDSPEDRTPPAALRGTDLKQAGQQQAIDHAHTEWKQAFTAQVYRLALTGRPFTSEDVLEVVGLPTGAIASNRNNAVGALMTAAAKRGLIHKTWRRVPSKRPTSHGAELTEWTGNKP